MAFAATGWAQEAARVSLASEQAAEQQKKTSDLGYYNVDFGPVHTRFQAELGLEGNDNVNYSPTNRVADFVVRPGINIRSLVPITEDNRFYFSVGAGYLKYMKESSLDMPYVTPDSALTFQMYISDFVVNLHNRISLTQDGGQIPTTSGTGRTGRLEDMPGVGVDWDLNQLILSGSYDFDLMRATDQLFEFGDRNSQLFSSKALLIINQSTRAGLQAGGGLTSYTEPFDITNRFNDNSHFNVGPFCEAQITDHIKGTLAAGYVSYFLDPGVVTNHSTLATFYGLLGVEHQVNGWLTESVNLSHTLQNGFNVVLLDLYRAQYKDLVTLFQDTYLTASFAYENGTSYGAQTEFLSRYIVAAGISHQFTPQFVGSLDYTFFSRNSNFSWGDYYQNRLALNLRYSF